ncbi:MAG: acyltransferase family protein, partial [Sphingomonas sp.]|uniref:acyltransferase family protein n=1 Tax=Sphingomonas sp. TaxID=28214 RepID=UPI003F38FF24
MSLPGPAGNQPDRPNTAAAPATTHRFVALDSLRGVCACIVVLYHLGGTIQLTELPLIRAGWLFVDFFFVLSGFVIAAAYRDRLARGFPVGRFMVLRLGRIYPLHVAVLLTMVAWESARLKLGGGWGHETFPADRVPSAVPVNLALLQIFGLYDRPTWNGPSWSIAAEVWTYLAAALCFQ